ncbi:hypothetical protein LS482_17210 [Sinomicrobium kalidii]|uniref:hypothetical protein n=1 Tax=Sinomicrobium kalidii TaxID=2900738 RepID=UPI001E3F3BBB|nr:hypothetical protein [Sinomicrobium kalidii]UGU15408.1 hypothetical protein LS482_17210 [Sinomicrobium kalidii]
MNKQILNTIGKMKNHKPKYYILRISIFTILFIGGLTNCSRIIPCNLSAGLEPMKQKPAPDFLIGHYVPDAKTTEMIEGFKNGSLNIKPDGSFEMKNIPVGVFDFDAYYAGKTDGVEAKGNWKAIEHEMSTYLSADLNFNKNQTDLEGYIVSWQIFSKDDRAVILIPVGDPDECMSVRLIKE